MRGEETMNKKEFDINKKRLIAIDSIIKTAREQGRQEVLDFIIAESLKLDNYQSARYAFESLIRKLKGEKT